MAGTVSFPADDGSGGTTVSFAASSRARKARWDSEKFLNFSRLKRFAAFLEPAPGAASPNTSFGCNSCESRDVAT